MSVKILVVCSMVWLALSGCQSVPEQQYSAAQREQMAAVEFIRPYELSRNDVSFTPLGAVSGFSCQTSIMQAAASEAEALLSLKLAAVDVGANVLVLRQCQQQDRDGCRSAWVCHGDAHQMQPLQ